MHQLSDLPAWASALLDEQPVAHLGLLDESGHPRVQPITFARLENTLVSAIDDAKPKRTRAPARLARLQRDPRATLTVDRYDDDWTRLAWVQILATATITPVREAALHALQDRYPVYRTQPPPGPLIVFTPIRILAWRASG
ncbi:pyridoxamine 5'-phosphate oxidase family protein [Solirubrobacter sp. CPCC 204708]|uniref:Pyridoxamine 5'-phosphate oxidase family protein n=1 Tax=Solirubrobacter deserti TaxID=2282478 RepID=A0ABT4RCT1_9ACTN|nr:pyridoxamine 5'-phosphate oxidase family protein [Solirubrobacter deserti]MBE2317916.1 pyridoxamine 5'-phosphate oxidase family protein [Solirubrobacter deserti]MDA0136306.1 pyridoxamine 5'-phosphate oxidase family protein [Solirubrobacter deserti]